MTNPTDPRVRELCEALAECAKRLRSCASIAGNADWAVDALCAPFEAALAAARAAPADEDGWQPIETAPRDGSCIQARIPGHGEDNIITWQGGLVDENERDCAAWTFANEEQEPPDCWTDGWCWAVNEHGKPSVQPTHWKRPAEARP